MSRVIKNKRPLRIVLTGVENSGKSSLIKPLAERFNWPYILELCRENEDVLNGKETFDTLLSLQKLNESRVKDLMENTKSLGIFCDTGSIVLDFWSESVFGKRVSTHDQQITDTKVDLYLLCETIEKWEVDPIRLIPDYDKRLEMNDRFRRRLDELNLPYIEVPVKPILERVDLIENEIKNRFNV